MSIKFLTLSSRGSHEPMAINYPYDVPAFEFNVYPWLVVPSGKMEPLQCSFQASNKSPLSLGIASLPIVFRIN